MASQPRLSHRLELMPIARSSVLPNPARAQFSLRDLEIIGHLNRWDAAGMAVGAAVLLMCSLIFTSRSPFFWSDELATWTMVNDPSVVHMLGAIWRGTENNPPLFELLLRPWAAIAGTSSFALRLPSTLFIVGAFLILWATLRRAYGVVATSLGMATVFFGAQVILEQLTQTRFYGLFTFCASLAVAVTLSAARAPNVRRGLLVATFLSHLALVYSHVFGGFYSAAILFGVVLVGVQERRVRPALYCSVLAAWVVLALWVPAVLAQRHMGEARSWIQRPTREDLFAVVVRQTFLLPFVIAATAAASVLRGPFNDTGRQSPPSDSTRFGLMVIAIMMLGVVLVVFLLSRVSTPVFVDRYIIPSALGWAVLVAEVAQRSLAPASSDGISDPRGGSGLRRPAVGYAALYCVLALYPITWALAHARVERPTVTVSADLAGLPVVVESLHEFWPLQHYAARTEDRYRFVLDRDVAGDSANFSGAGQEYKLMQLYRDEGYLAGSVVDATRFSCGTRRFLVVDRPDFTWFERRILRDDAYLWRTVGEYHGSPVQLVERVRDCAPT